MILDLWISQVITCLRYTFISCLTGTLLSSVCCNLVVIEIPTYSQHLPFSKQICVFSMSPVVSGGCHHHRNPSSYFPSQLFGAAKGSPTVTHPDWRHYYGRSLRKSYTLLNKMISRPFDSVLCFNAVLFIFSTDVTFLPVSLWVGNMGRKNVTVVLNTTTLLFRSNCCSVLDIYILMRLQREVMAK